MTFTLPTPTPDDDAPFADVRRLLAQAHFTEAVVARRLGGTTLYAAPRLADGRTTMAGAVEDANAALIRLFIDGAPLARDVVARYVGGSALAALEATQLVATSPDDEACIVATAMLYPTQGLWIASDRQPTHEEQTSQVARDYVFSAIGELTRDFLALLPDASGQRTIELCSGTGIAALRALAQGATEAWATDVVPRCIRFIRVNARLNALADRLVVVESDAWDALGDETFDLVVAHPPYVPALAHRFDFRDGGVDGESITRRIVEGVGAHVRPGGRCILRAALSDRKDGRMIERVRRWTGDASAELDVVTIEHGEYGPMDAYRSATRGGKDYVDCERWLRHFDALGIERFAVCAVELRRDAIGKPPITERRVSSVPPRHAALDWTFDWARFLRDAGETPAARLAGQHPRVPAGVRLAVHLQSDADGAWHNAGAAVETSWPTHALVRAPALVPTLLELCDGTRDLEALLAGLRSAGLVGDDVSVADVAQLVEVLTAAGAVELAACPLPHRSEE